MQTVRRRGDREDPAEQSLEDGELHGLLQEGGRSGLECARVDRWVLGARQHDDGRGAVQCARADFPGEGDAVHVGHGVVDADHAGPRLAQEVECGIDLCEWKDGAFPPRPRDAFQDRSREGTIVDDDNREHAISPKRKNQGHSQIPSKTTVGKPAGAGFPRQSGRSVGHEIACRIEGRAKLRAECTARRDDAQRQQRCDQPVFDRGRPALVLEKLLDCPAHCEPPCSITRVSF